MFTQELRLKAEQKAEHVPPGWTPRPQTADTFQGRKASGF